MRAWSVRRAGARRARAGGNHRLRLSLAVCTAALLAATSPGARSQAQEPARGASLAELRERRDNLEAELARLAAERASIVRDFEAADVELALRRQQLDILQRRAVILEAERAEQQQRILDLDRQLVAGRETLRDRVVSLYRVGPLSYNRLLVSAETAADALVAYQIITYMASRDRDLVSGLRDTLLELAAAHDAVDETEAQLARVRVETAATAEALAEQQEQRRALLLRIDREVEGQRIALQQAERAAGELEATLSSLSVDSALVDTNTFGAARGTLPWPAAGPVSTEFGRRRHPVYDTITLSRGIEIDGESGDPVLSVHAGRVVFADWYSGYGLLVIVDHGHDYFTLYGHLRETAVRVTERIAAGQLIGRVGDTGSLTGPNLYFEVREGADALDPRAWLTPGGDATGR